MVAAMPELAGRRIEEHIEFLHGHCDPEHHDCSHVGPHDLFCEDGRRTWHRDAARERARLRVRESEREKQRERERETERERNRERERERERERRAPAAHIGRAT
jgi:hypothetical protein